MSHPTGIRIHYSYNIPNLHIGNGCYQSGNTQLEFQCLWRKKGEMCIFEWRKRMVYLQSPIKLWADRLVSEYIISYDIPNPHIGNGYYQSGNTQLEFQCLWRQKGEMCIFEWRKRCYEPWVNVPHVGLETLLILACLQHTTMGWVHPSFRQILLDHCNEYINSSDRGSDKTWSKLITRVSKDITDIAEVIPLPSDIEKVINWSISVSSNTDLCL